MAGTYQILLRESFPKELSGWGKNHDRLWYSGNLQLLKHPMVSVVGSRDLSREGAARTRKLTRLLVSNGICVVSGLAEGVDAEAHDVALENRGMTIAVMGTPIDECYPASHSGLKKEIEKQGLVLSQFPPGSIVQRGNFPQRNELMAALSAITIVIEAKIDSGTRHQVKSALGYGRQVGFLASLAEKRFPWIQDAMVSGNGFSITTAEDFERRVKEIISEHYQSPVKSLTTSEADLPLFASETTLEQDPPTSPKPVLMSPSVEQPKESKTEIKMVQTEHAPQLPKPKQSTLSRLLNWIGRRLGL